VIFEKYFCLFQNFSGLRSAGSYPGKKRGDFRQNVQSVQFKWSDHCFVTE